MVRALDIPFTEGTPPVHVPVDAADILPSAPMVMVLHEYVPGVTAVAGSVPLRLVANNVFVDGL